nr:hypothetical protein WG33_0388 [uncultured bacterium]
MRRERIVFEVLEELRELLDPAGRVEDIALADAVDARVPLVEAVMPGRRPNGPAGSIDDLAAADLDHADRARTRRGVIGGLEVDRREVEHAFMQPPTSDIREEARR